jgi:hypothetical protein
MPDSAQFQAEAELHAEIAKKLAAYEKARDAWQANREDAKAAAKWADAQQDIHEYRKFWRTVGEEAGLRTPVPTAATSQEG